MTKTIKTIATIGLALLICNVIRVTAQTTDELFALAEKTFKEANELENSEATIPQALPKYQAAQQLYSQVGEKRGEGNALRGIARISLYLRKRDDAIAAYQRALDLFGQIDRKSAIATVLIELGNIYFQSVENKQLELALGYYQRAESVAHEVPENKQMEANAQFNLGAIYLKLGNKTQAVNSLQKALTAYKGFRDELLQALTLHHLGMAYSLSQIREDQRQAYEYFSEAVSLYLPKGKKIEAANSMIRMGNIDMLFGNALRGIENYKNSLTAFRQGGGQKLDIALTLENLSHAYSLSQSEADLHLAIENGLETARMFHELGIKEKEANLLANIGAMFFRLKNKEEVLKHYRQAQAIYRELMSTNEAFKSYVAKGFVYIGAAYEYLGDKDELSLARENYLQAQALYQQLHEFFRKSPGGNQENQINALRELADTLFRLRDKAGAIENYQKARTLCSELKDQSCEATMLSAIAGTYQSVEKTEDTIKAIANYKLAKQAFHNVGNRSAEIWCLRRMASAQRVLNNMPALLQTNEELTKVAEAFDPVGQDLLKGEAYISMGEAYQALQNQTAALEKLEAARLIGIELPNKDLEVDALAAIIQLHVMSNEPAKILESCRQLLAILPASNSQYHLKKGYAHLMRSHAYTTLRDNDKALAEMQLGVQLLQQTSEQDIADLSRIFEGNSYLVSGDQEKERSRFSEIEKQLPRLSDQARVFALFYLAISLSQTHDFAKAWIYVDQGLSLSRKLNVPFVEALNLTIMGFIKWEEDKNREAADLLQHAVAIFHQLMSPQFEATSLAGLMYSARDLKNPRRAIFYGKLAVILLQAVRRNIKSLDSELQKGYVGGFSELYRELTNLLIQERRFDEAQQIINLERDQQAFDISDDENPGTKKLQFSESEKASSKVWETELTSLGEVISELHRLQLSQAAAANAAAIAPLKLEDHESYKRYLATLKRIETDFALPPDGNDIVTDVSDAATIQTILHELSLSTKNKTAVLYTFIGNRKLYVLVHTLGQRMQLFESPIDINEFNRQILQLYALLQSKVYDPRQLAKEVHDAIIPKELSSKLQNEKIETLIWSLDGSLRYIPFAALSPDGVHYLVEHYNHVVITRADSARLTRKVSSIWQGYGFFTFEPQSVKQNDEPLHFPALDKGEAEVFRTNTYRKGIVDGKIFDGPAFTLTALRDIAKQPRPLVHISSHFVFHPGDPDRSFLLLGDETAVSVAELKKYPNIFQGVELLTLSACDTAAQFPRADGKEIDAFAELAQRFGAGSVMASLWSVSDISTTQLMKSFYRAREVQKLNKASALRQSQLDLLYGRHEKPAADNQNKDAAAKGDPRTDLPVVDQRYRIDFKKDWLRPYAHPYYWSLFVLYGNPQ